MSATASACPTAVRSRGRRSLHPSVAFVGMSATFAALFLAAGAPSPLLVLFQREWGFPAWQLTIAVSGYSFGLLAALLVTGRLSDHLGRRPVIIGALALELVSLVLFLGAHSIALVIAARVVQGVATGIATSAFSATVIEHAPENRKRIAAVLTGVAPAGGLGLGALLAGATAELSADAGTIVFGALSALVIAGLVVTALSAETVTPSTGALASLRPRLVVPRSARRDFTALAPLIVAAWMTATLFLGLAPSILRGVFGIDDELVIGAVAFAEPASAAIASILFARLSVSRSLLVSGAAMVLGAVIIVVGIAAASLPGLIVGGVLGGVGFGLSFSAALRRLAPHAEAHERAGLFAAVYTVSYLAFGVPVVVAGLLIAPVGLLAVAVGFGAAILLAAGLGLGAQVRRR